MTIINSLCDVKLEVNEVGYSPVTADLDINLDSEAGNYYVLEYPTNRTSQTFDSIQEAYNAVLFGRLKMGGGSC